jgi:hypothetical protein
MFNLFTLLPFNYQFFSHLIYTNLVLFYSIVIKFISITFNPFIQNIKKINQYDIILLIFSFLFLYTFIGRLGLNNLSQSIVMISIEIITLIGVLVIFLFFKKKVALEKISIQSFF